MKISRALLLIALCSAAILTSITCSKIQNSTDLGADLVNDLDPRIADLNANYRQEPVSLHIDSLYSANVGNDGIRLPPQLFIPVIPGMSAIPENHITDLFGGIWNGDTAKIYCSFTDTPVVLVNSRTDTIKQLVLTFTPDSALHGSKNAVQHFKIWKLLDKRDSLNHLATTGAIDVGTLSFASDSTGKFKADSITLVSDSKNTYFDTAKIHRINCFNTYNTVPANDTNGPIITLRTKIDTITACQEVKSIQLHRPYFYLEPIDAGIIRFYPPVLTATLIGKKDITIYDKLDSIKDTTTQQIPLIRSDVSVFEINPALRNTLPVSSWSTGRRTVAQIDLRPFWKAMVDSATGRKFLSIQSAILKIKTADFKMELHTAADSTDSVIISYVLDVNPPAIGYSQNTLGKVVAASAMDSTINIDLRRDFLLFQNMATRPQTAYLNLGLRPKKNEKWSYVRWDLTSGANITILSAFSFPK